MHLLDNDSSVEERWETVEERVRTDPLLQLLFYISLLGVLVMVLGLLREEDDGDSPPGFKKITDPEHRRLAAMVMDTGDPIDLYLSEGESTTLPSGAVIEKTTDGFIIKYK